MNAIRESTRRTPLTARRNRVSRVISACEARDISVWTVTSRQVIRLIDADSYQLVCPDDQIGVFEAATAPGWEITGESRFSSNCQLDMIRGKVSGANTNRVHWLFQQFIKINAIAESDLDDGELVVIWDADTVPLRKIDFSDGPTGCIRYYHGKEHHQPYFDTIEALCDLERLTNLSFIAQCLPVRAGWVRELLQDIEERLSQSYVEAVLSRLPGKSGSEFSEYETIGAWVLAHHRDEMVFRKKNRWLRSGSSFFGSRTFGPMAMILFRLLAIRYDFVAIENWRRPFDMKRLSKAAFRIFGRG